MSRRPCHLVLLLLPAVLSACSSVRWSRGYFWTGPVHVTDGQVIYPYKVRGTSYGAVSAFDLLTGREAWGVPAAGFSKTFVNPAGSRMLVQEFNRLTLYAITPEGATSLGGCDLVDLGNRSRVFMDWAGNRCFIDAAGHHSSALIRGYDVSDRSPHVRWEISEPQKQGLAFEDGVLVLRTYNRVRRLDPGTGETLWETKEACGYPDVFKVSQERVVWCGWDRKVRYCRTYDSRSGQLLVETPLPGVLPTDSWTKLVWTEAGIILGTHDGNLHCVTERRFKWKTQLGRSYDKRLIHADGITVYVLAWKKSEPHKGALFRLNGTNGKIDWKVPFQGAQRSVLLSSAEDYLFVTRRSVLRCLNSRTGRDLWTLDGVSSERAYAGPKGSLILKSGGRLFGLDPQTPKVLWSFSTSTNRFKIQKWDEERIIYWFHRRPPVLDLSIFSFRSKEPYTEVGCLVIPESKLSR